MSAPDPDDFPRCLPLQGTPNFRDFGGYDSLDGRRVKRGYLFRSGQLSTLSASDQNLLAELELDLVCDFRRLEEQERDPSLLPVPGPQVVSLPITPGSNASFFDEAESHWQTDAQTMFNFMVEINRDFALQQSESYACMFDMLVQTDDARAQEKIASKLPFN